MECKDTRILGLRRRGIQSGARDKAESLRALYNKICLSINEIDKTSDIGIRRGQEE